MKVIRDSIWGDIRLSEAEIDIVNSRTFQRLRKIRQLGLAHLIYPGAVHTRFQHSIGTVQAAQTFIDAVNNNGVIIDDESAKVARVVALLHDIGHIPFAHLLEDEGGFYERHDSSSRIAKFLDELEKQTGNAIDPLARSILERKKVDPIHTYIEDLVYNTVCADLIDYIRRDGYFTGATGLGFRFDDRLLHFFKIIQDEKGDSHMVLEPVKDKIRLDLFTDLMQLLRYRYVLTERVTYHHAKLAGSAMLLKAFRELGPIPEENLHDLGDDELLQLLLKWSHDKSSEALVQDLLDRKLHKPVFRVTRQTVSKVMSPEEFAKKFGTPDGRMNLEQEIIDAAEKLLGRRMNETSISIYASPDATMTLKEAGVFVRWRGKAIKRLKDIQPEEYWEVSVKEEVDALQNRYGALWTAYVFLAPADIDFAFEVEKACARVLGLENDVLLTKRLKQYDAYAEMEIASGIVSDLPLARKGVTIAHRLPSGTSKEDRIRSGVDLAIKDMASKDGSKSRESKDGSLDEFK